MGDRIDPIFAFHNVIGLIQQLLDHLVFPRFFVLIVTRLAQRFVKFDAAACSLGAV